MINPGSVPCDLVGGPVGGEIYPVDLQGTSGDGAVLIIGLPEVVPIRLPEAIHRGPAYYRLTATPSEGRPQYRYVPPGQLGTIPGCPICAGATRWTPEEYEAHLDHGGDRPEVIAE